MKKEEPWKRRLRRFARECVNSLPDEHVLMQLESRNVGSIDFVRKETGVINRALESGFGSIRREASGEKLLIRVAWGGSLSKWSLVIGHELGHTFTTSFWYGKVAERHEFIHAIHNGPDPVRESSIHCAEFFCERFAQLWLRARTNRVELQALLACTLQRGELITIGSSSYDFIRSIPAKALLPTEKNAAARPQLDLFDTT